MFKLQVVDLILQCHGNSGLIDASNPGMTLCLIDCVPLCQVELGQSVKQVLGQIR